MIKFTVYSESDGRVLFSGSGSGVEDMQLMPGQKLKLGHEHLDGWIDSDGQHHAVPSAPSKFHTWSWEDKAWVALLPAAKEMAWLEVKNWRSNVEFGPFTYNGYRFDGDSAAQRRINLAVMGAQAALIAGVSWSMDWTLADNSVVTLSAVDMVGVAQALGANIAAAHEEARLKRAEIENATTLEELETICGSIFTTS